jgi:UDP-N-acetylmuramoylalanine--D-glutamate ligase
MVRREAGGGRREADGSVLPGRVAILGFARSGQALARALLDRGVEVSIGDRRSVGDFPDAQEFAARGARLFFDGPDEAFLEGADWLALSPGVPASSEVVQRARASGVEVFAEFEIAWRIAQSQTSSGNRWVAVTGTNGKSTTTAWIAHLLERAGRPVALAGNIGVPLSDFLHNPSPRDFVCELSSFQLETIDRFRADVAVLTNVTPDHLDRYGDFREYAAAKARIFRNQTPQDFAVVNADDPMSSATESRARRVPFSRRGRAAGGVWAAGGWIRSELADGERQILERGRLALPGAHNLENALAAVAAAECLRTPDSAVREGLTDFEGLAHRTELVAESGGVKWIDDSKGTNVDATAKSLEDRAPGSVILILGGRDKHGDFAALRTPVGRAAARILTIGEAAPVVERALAGAAPIERCATMDRAVARAAELARPGQTVLLSPACASFDQYPNFEERGRHFAELARGAAATSGLGTRNSGQEKETGK